MNSPRKNHAVATAVGAVLFIMIASTVLGLMGLALSSETGSAQAGVAAQNLLNEKSKEFLAGYTLPSGKIQIVDSGPVESKIVALSFVDQQGNAELCPSPPSCTISPSLPIVLLPTSSVYFSLSGAPQGASISTITSLGNSFVVCTCAPPNTIVYYALTMASNPPQGGTTGPASSGIPYYYPAGVQVTITVCQASGYSWNGWVGAGSSGKYTGSGQGGQSSCSGNSPRHSAPVTMTGNITETANFG